MNDRIKDALFSAAVICAGLYALLFWLSGGVQ